ncbi:MAG TPA: c-type cytochrome, partial [Steroidobacteraceae bacterium]|nr:c-type cytochrome [Steroidobacteraceae bacterium]
MNGSLLGCLLAGMMGVVGSGTLRADTAPDTLEARAQGCATCHGTHGQGSSDENFPRIAGKPRGYLYSQLQNFRDGRRSYPPMNYLLAYMQDDYLGQLAEYFASQTLPAQAPLGEHRSDYAMAEQLVRAGDPAHGIPACVACHGPSLT